MYYWSTFSTCVFQLAREKVGKELSPNHYETVELQAIDLLNSEPCLQLGLQSNTEKKSSPSPLECEGFTHEGWSVLPDTSPCRVRLHPLSE